MQIYGVGIVVALLHSGAATARADAFKSIARELASAAGNARLERVAVLPFVAAEGGDAAGGWNISEKLVTQLVRARKVQTVERSRLRGLMEEHHLARTGLIDPAGIKRLGKILAADGIVTGSFVNVGRYSRVNARLVDIETGVIVAAIERRVERDWFDEGGGSPADRPLWIPAPELIVDPPPLPSKEFLELRDTIADASCERASERVDDLERQVLDIKARYWALQLRKGLSLARLRHNPGSTISDPALKKAFYDRMKFWYEQEAVPPLTAAEVRRFIAFDGKAYSLHRECGV